MYINTEYLFCDINTSDCLTWAYRIGWNYEIALHTREQSDHLSYAIDVFSSTRRIILSFGKATQSRFYINLNFALIGVWHWGQVADLILLVTPQPFFKRTFIFAPVEQNIVNLTPI